MTDAGESKRAGQGFTAVGKGDSKSGEAKLVEETPEGESLFLSVCLKEPMQSCHG